MVEKYEGPLPWLFDLPLKWLVGPLPILCPPLWLLHHPCLVRLVSPCALVFELLPPKVPLWPLISLPNQLSLDLYPCLLLSFSSNLRAIWLQSWTVFGLHKSIHSLIFHLNPLMYLDTLILFSSYGLDLRQKIWNSSIYVVTSASYCFMVFLLVSNWISKSLGR